MTIVISIIAALVICGLVLFIIEIKKAPLIEDTDVVINENSVDTFKTVFCDHCIKNLDGHCNNGRHFGIINEEMEKLCKKNGFFEPK